MAANPKSVRFHLPAKSIAAESAVQSPGPETIETVAVLERRRAHITELVPASLRHDMIAMAAYHRSVERGFAPGHELEDWLAAEREVDETLRARYSW